MIIKSESGFTIIEVMLVLGITGMLILISFIGQGSIREQTQFTNTAEDFLTKLEGYKSEATRTVGVSNLNKDEKKGCTGGVGQRIDCINIGVLVDLNDDDILDGYQYKTSSIIADRTVSSSGVDDSLLSSYNPRSVAAEEFGISYNIRIKSSLSESTALPKIAFIRHPYSGSIQTHVLGSGQDLTAMNDSTLSEEASFSTS
jgi:type II secretory pathway pseudopilin PulG